MSSSQRLLVELSTYSLQAAVVAGGRLVAHREFAPDDNAGLAAFVTEHAAGLPLDVALLAPASGFAELLNSEETASLNSASAILARASATAGIGTLAAVCDVVEGRIPRIDVASRWLLAGISSETADAASQQLASLGLTPATVAPALPAELGGVVELTRNTPGAPGVAVWEPGDSSGRLWRISSAGVESVKELPVGFRQIFEVVQTELGLKFRAAATKLFFNGDYQFGEAEDKIAVQLAGLLRDALGETPAAFHVIGLPTGQAWLVRALARALGSTAWAPVESTATSRYGVSADLLSPRVVGLLQAAAAGWVRGQWLPAWITPDTAIPAKSEVTPAPAPAPKPSPAPVVVAPPSAAPAPAPVPVPSKPVPVAPAPKKPAVPAPPVAPVKPKPAPVKPAAVAPVKPAPVPPVAPVAPTTAAPTTTSAGRKFPVVPAVLAGVVVLALLGGGIAFFRKPASKSQPTVSTPAVTPKPAANPTPTVTPKPAATPAPAVVSPPIPWAVLEAEVKRDPVSFKNEHYQFKVSNKGVLTDFTVAGRPHPWIRNLGFVRLYGVSTLPDGRKTARRAGDMSSPDYRATVLKRIRDGVVVFDVNVTHSKFTLTQTFVCLPNSLQVEVRFKPTALVDAYGPLDAVYSVHFETADFVSPGSKPQMRPGELIYRTKAGQLVLRYDPAFKGAGPQPVVGDPSLASFMLAVAGGQTEQLLNYEIPLP